MAVLGTYVDSRVDVLYLVRFMCLHECQLEHISGARASSYSPTHSLTHSLTPIQTNISDFHPQGAEDILGNGLYYRRLHNGDPFDECTCSFTQGVSSILSLHSLTLISSPSLPRSYTHTHTHTHTHTLLCSPSSSLVLALPKVTLGGEEKDESE